MARGDVTIFNEFVAQLGAGDHNLVAGGDTIKLGLINNTLTPLAAVASPTWTDYSANQVATTGGYVNGGVTLTGQTYTEEDGVATFDDTGNISLAQNASGFTDAYWGILYNDTNATKMAIAFVDLAGPVSEVAGPVTINWNAAGIFILTVASSS